MANLLGALRFMLGADTAAFEQGMRNASSRLQSFGVQAQRTAAIVATAFVGVGAALSLGINRALREGEQLHRLSQQIGVSTEALSVLKEIADDSGVSLESLSTAMTRLGRSMAEAASDSRSAAARTFEALGISATNAAGQLRPIQEVFNELAVRLSRIEDGGGKVQIMMNLLGRAGAELIPMMNRLGTEGFRGAAEQAERLGQVWSGPAAAAAAQFRQTLRDLGDVKDGIIRVMAERLLPTLQTMADWMLKASESTEGLKNAMTVLDTVLKLLITTGVVIKGVFETLGAVIGTVAGAMMLVARGEFQAAWNTLREGARGMVNDIATELTRLQQLWSNNANTMREVAGKLGADVRREAAPIITTTRALGDAARAARDAARAALDDIVNMPTETFTAKMEAINRAVRDGTITMRQYGQMVRQVTRENQQHWFDLGTATANALTTIFSKNKVAQVASIIILTSVAIMRALATLPPPFSWAQAALAAAVGAAQLANVKSTTMSGGGKAPTVSSGGGGDSGAGAEFGAPTACPDADPQPRTRPIQQGRSRGPDRADQRRRRGRRSTCGRAMILVSQALVLAPAGIPLNTPLIGYQNIASAGTITATSEADGYPASNLGNPSTALRWRAAEEGSPPVPPAADQYLTVTINQVDPVDYLAIAVHNLGSGQNPVSVEGSDGGSPEWFELVEESIQANDDPIVFRFAPQSLTGIRLLIQSSLLSEPTVPFVAVLYVGKLLVLERGTHADHTPINLGRTTRVMNGKSETGNFLGRVVLSESRSTSFALNKLRETWYRANFDPFVKAAQEGAFFFAWKPTEHPNDVGFVTLTNDVQPTRDFNTATIAVTLQMSSVAVP